MAFVEVVRQRGWAWTEAHAALFGGGDALHLVLLALLLPPLISGGEDQLSNEDVQRVTVPGRRKLGKAGYDLSGEAAQLLTLAAAGGYRGLQSVLF